VAPTTLFSANAKWFHGSEGPDRVAVSSSAPRPDYYRRLTVAHLRRTIVISRATAICRRIGSAARVQRGSYHRKRAVKRLARVLAANDADFEIIVVDDGSVDNTGAILAGQACSEPELHVRIVSHVRNRGYGAALASGFDQALYVDIFLGRGRPV
jgi:hypothetical protein